MTWGPGALRAPSLAAVLVAIGLVACARPATVFKDVGGVEPVRGALPTEVAPAGWAFAPGGVVAAPHPDAAAAGEALLRAGGSAVDAAVGAALVIGVVANQSSGLGGGGFAVVRDPAGETTALDFRETAPSFFDPGTFQVEGRSSRRGAWAVGVPGEAAGLAELHRRGGRLPWRDVVEPARRLAADGFVVDSRLAKTLDRFADEVLADPGLRGDYAPQGTVLKEGDRCVRPGLASTLGYLQVHGGDAFYSGPIPVALAGFLAEQGAPWTASEFAAYEPVTREPVSGTYRDHTVFSMPPPSSGGVALLQMLGLLERLPVEGEHAPARRLAAAMSHAFADRATYGGDPEFAEVPVAAMLASDLLDRLAASTPASGPVDLHGAGLAGERGDTKALLGDDGGTTHISVLDGAGGAVALTTTVNLSFGAAIQDPATGILLNDEMDDFTARPGEPNAFGLVQGEANKVEPGKRPLSSMTPTLVVDPNGRTVLAVGGAGGPRIITGTLQALLAVLDDGLDPRAAVARPRIHHQWLPRAVFAEAGAFDDAQPTLAAEGFEFKPLGYAGIVQAAAFDPTSGRWSGGADPRGNGGVKVWQP